MDYIKYVGLIMGINMTNITNVTADLVIEPQPYNTTDTDNIIMTSLWALGIYSCGTIISNLKSKDELLKDKLPNKDDLPFEIYKSEIEEKYKLYVKDNGKLKENLEKLQKDINELKKIIDKKKKENDEYLLEEHKDDNEIIDFIDEDVVYKYGEGQIRYKIGEKYYHGVGVNELYKWNPNNKFDKCFFEYIEDNKLPQDGSNNKWNTHNANDFCNCCIIDEELSKRRKVCKIYQCSGHSE